MSDREADLLGPRGVEGSAIWTIMQANGFSGTPGDEVTEPERQCLYELSADRGTVQSLGRLSHETGEHHWNGSISLDRRIENGEVRPDRLEEARSRLGEFFVPADGSKRCGDSRTAKGYVDVQPAWFYRPRGPQALGASALDAVSARLAFGNRRDVPFKQATLEGDIALLAQKVLGYKVGGHPGCAGIAEVETSLEFLTDPYRLEDVEHITRVVLGARNFEEPAFEHVMVSAVRMVPQSERYFAGKANVLNTLASHNPHAVHEVSGEHLEGIVNFNETPDVFNNDHWNEVFPDIGVFNVDVWDQEDTAHHLDEDPDTRSRFLHGGVAVDIALLMGITDGSLELTRRVPNRT
jgi:hypothetical protein